MTSPKGPPWPRLGKPIEQIDSEQGKSLARIEQHQRMLTLKNTSAQDLGTN
jgi:hypothetical protein